MRKLYEIDAAIEQCIMNGTDCETGEFLGWDELTELQMEREAKLEGVALFVKDTRAEAAAIEAEMKTLKDRMDKLNKNADGAERWLEGVLGGEKFSTSKVECRFRKSVSVEVADDFIYWATVHGKYDLINHKETDTPDKAKIKELLKNGGNLANKARLVEKQNLTVR